MRLIKRNKFLTTAILLLLSVFIYSQLVIQQNISNVVWDDLRVVPGAFQFAGGNDPSLGNYQPTGSGATFKLYVFQLNDEAFATIQMPHTYKESTSLYFHLHWTPRDRGNEESGNTVGWKIDYSIANVGGTFPASGTVDLSDACSGVDDQHEISASVEVSGSGFTISNMIILRIYRSDTGADDTWAGVTVAQSPAILEFDIHFQINSLGSNSETTKE